MTAFLVLSCLGVCCDAGGGGDGGRSPRATHGAPPLATRGARAWEQARLVQPVLTNRLCIHAVDDNTNRRYIKEVKRLLQDVQRHGTAFDTYAERDAALANYLSSLCYLHLSSVGVGNAVFFGFLHIYEDHRDKMPQSARALKSWLRMASQGEGKPMDRSSIACVAMWLLKRGKLYECLLVLISFDCCLREQDWSLLRTQDVSFDKEGASLALGVRARGETVKTGSDQGAVVRFEVVRAILKAAVQVAHEGDLIFPLSAATFRKRWWEALKDLNLEWCGPPHAL